MQTHEQDLTTALEIIEQASRDHPYCAACGEPTHPVAHNGVIWLECRSLTDSKSRLARIISFHAGHTRRVLVNDSTTTPVSETS
jgi:hypothetical protein